MLFKAWCQKHDVMSTTVLGMPHNDGHSAIDTRISTLLSIVLSILCARPNLSFWAICECISNIVIHDSSIAACFFLPSFEVLSAVWVVDVKRWTAFEASKPLAYLAIFLHCSSHCQWQCICHHGKLQVWISSCSFGVVPTKVTALTDQTCLFFTGFQTSHNYLIIYIYW